MDAIKEGLLKVDPGLLLWTIITFLVLLLILWKTAWKPIVEALDSRAEGVSDDVEKARQARLESEEMLAQHKEMIDNARAEARAVIDDSKAQAEKVKSEIIEKANQQAGVLLAKAKQEIDLAKEKVISEIHAEVVNLSTEIASKIISRNLNPGDQSSIVKEALSNLNKTRLVQ